MNQEIMRNRKERFTLKLVKNIARMNDGS